MKQGTNFELPITIDVNLDDVTSISFLFVQGDVSKSFTYPGTYATRVDNNTVKLKWTAADTWAFTPKHSISMDTLITMNGTTNNPETSIVSFMLSPTLFEEPEEE